MLLALKPKEIIMTSLKLVSASVVALVALSAGPAFALDRTAEQRQADGDAFRASQATDEACGTPNLHGNQSSRSRAEVAAEGRRAVKDGTATRSGELV